MSEVLHMRSEVLYAGQPRPAAARRRGLQAVIFAMAVAGEIFGASWQLNL
jgi:hypothetical protein